LPVLTFEAGLIPAKPADGDQESASFCRKTGFNW
jgi:hypothetical protein